MSPPDPSRFLLRQAAVAAACAAVVLPAVARFGGQEALFWAAVGWLVTALPAAGSGFFIERVHGGEVAPFLKTLGACMLARLVPFAVGCVFAVSRDRNAFLGFLVGIVAGYLPVQFSEGLWFVRKSSTVPVRKAHQP